jgi:hypothetical protein
MFRHIIYMEKNMATKKSDGSSFSVVPNRSDSGTRENHGSARRVAGSSALANVVVSPTAPSDGGNLPKNGSTTDKALSAGVFTYNNSRGVAMRSTVAISSVSNTVLQTASDVPSFVTGIHKNMTYVTRKASTAFRAGKFNLVTGAWENAYPAVATDTFADDQAAMPTRAVPGEFVYKLGQPVPVMADYSAKTS